MKLDDIQQLIDMRKHQGIEMSLFESLWWRFMPGVTITVRWPRGQVQVGPGHREGWSGTGEYFEYVESSDPNDHYRPWLEQHVGRQGWDWNWRLFGNNVAEDCQTIKIRRPKTHWCSIIALQWN